MQIDYQDGLFLSRCSFDERLAFQDAGWFWHPEHLAWATLNGMKVNAFAEYATPSVKHALKIWHDAHPLKPVDILIEIDKPRGEILWGKSGGYSATSKTGDAWSNGKGGPEGGRIAVFVGLCGEEAFGKVIGQEPDLTKGPKDTDFVLPNGLKVEVKTTADRYGSLLVRRNIVMKQTADVYVLAYAELNLQARTASVAIRGYVTQKELATVRDIKGVKLYACWHNKEVHPSDLHNIQEILP